MEILEKVSLQSKTSWQVGGQAQYFCEPANIDEFIQAVEWAKSKNLPLIPLGGGSNVLISDKGVLGLVVSFSQWAGTEVSEQGDDLKIVAKSGTSKYELLKIFLKQKLAPAIFLAGIPGDVGGGVVMNAGIGEAITPREFVEIVEWVEVLKLDKVVRFSKDELKWSYRHCEGWGPGLILRVGISWPLQKDETILEKVKTANRTRLQKQPLDLPSCGSVFVNPPGEKAAQLIESCGLKGLQVGQAQVSLKHANFIVNLGGAKASDIRELISRVQVEVERVKGIKLKTEVISLGQL